RNASNIRVLLAEATTIDAGARKVLLDEGPPLEYDYLVVATGARAARRRAARAGRARMPEGDNKKARR
ncbi:MAG: FAD-dependent oxidoreductase, partial [Burkholderiales bacterium]|nr:FAD-dependent oxidoreductase [Opitutaceae bacterium]